MKSFVFPTCDSSTCCSANTAASTDAKADIPDNADSSTCALDELLVATEAQPAEEPVLQLPPPIRQNGRPHKRQMRVFARRCQVFECMATINKDWQRLCWLCEEEAVQTAIHDGKKVTIDDVKSDIDNVVTDDRCHIEEIKAYFTPVAWQVIQLITCELSTDDYPCKAHSSSDTQNVHKSVQCDHCLTYSHYKCAGV